MHTSNNTDDPQCESETPPLFLVTPFFSSRPQGSTMVTSCYFFQLRYFLHIHPLIYLLSMFRPFKVYRVIYLDMHFLH